MSRPQRAWRVAAATALALAGLLWSLRSFGPSNPSFAIIVVWIPMAWLGIVSRFVTPRLPEGFHSLRPFERSGHLYEVLGIRLFKSLLRRGPLAWFNPDLHLPAERTERNLAKLAQRMCDAEASHALLFVATLAIVVHALARGWSVAAAVTFASNVFMNGYPVMLQRYNRAYLDRRFDLAPK